MGNHLEVSVIVATFGDRRYRDTARDVALPSAAAAGAGEIIAAHGLALHEARNNGAAEATGEWLCFLDADDELEAGYLDAMAAASGDLRAPAVRLVVDSDNPREDLPAPVTFEHRDMRTLNPCAIGTLLRRTLFDDVGGFWSERAWEDWSLFRRCWLRGATIVHVPDAVYRYHVNPAGRNSTIDRPRDLRREIVNSHRRWIRTGKAPG